MPENQTYLRSFQLKIDPLYYIFSNFLHPLCYIYL